MEEEVRERQWTLHARVSFRRRNDPAHSSSGSLTSDTVGCAIGLCAWNSLLEPLCCAHLAGALHADEWC